MLLTPEQVGEIRERTKTIKSATIACDVFELISDRAEIAAENAELKKFAAGLELNLAAVIQRAEAAEGYLAELSPRYADIVAERAELRAAIASIAEFPIPSSQPPETAPEVPKCEKCGGTGWVEDTSGYVDFMMCQVCRMHQKKTNI